MHPVTVQFIVAMLAYALNERMARKADYLREENRVLKEALQAATGKSRIPLTNEQRRRLATKGKALTPAEREDCCQIVRPSTILEWFRKLAASKYDSSGSGGLVGHARRTKSGSWFSVSLLRIQGGGTPRSETLYAG